jgi:SAM-dependent methyltransferase
LIPFEQFVTAQLPEPPARVLEVGCGLGELTTALAAAGYEALGIDPSAPEGDLFRRLKLEELDASEGPFDAVVAAFSLHHVRDLERGLDRIAELLGDDGLLVLDELAWDRIDEPTLDWLLGQQQAFAAAGDDAPASLDELRSRWEAEHLGVHGFDALGHALDERFRERQFTWVPHLYRGLGGAETAVLEEALIEGGAIRALGFRYVGSPTR